MGWRYRVASSVGVGALTILAVWVANQYPVQWAFTTYTPLFWRLDPVVLSSEELMRVSILAVGAVVASLVPLFKPRPIRILDLIFMSQKRIIIAGSFLATLGYFNYSFRIPRATLTLIMILLVVAIPVWFVWIRDHPGNGIDRTILIGDDPEQLHELLEDDTFRYIGQVSPSTVSSDLATPHPVTDGGRAIPRLGGLTRVEDVLVEYAVDTAVLAFREPDRGDFFGALDACYDHGVDAKVHRASADSVLTSNDTGNTVVDVDIEPWDIQDYFAKRLFDVAFATIGLLLLSPVILMIAVTIKAHDGGPVLYAQNRTAGLGGEVQVYKFRTMVSGAEDQTGATISDEDAGGEDPRVTPVGRVLRRTHLDEIPQLWSIVCGDMSVVGPRPERPELEVGIDPRINWRKRWFVKPGLTGLAQINGVTGHDPDKKLRSDLEYIRRQSFWFDIKIVIRQLWTVAEDAIELLGSAHGDGGQDARRRDDE